MVSGASRIGLNRPAEDAPAADIQDRDQIEPTLAGQDAGGIGDPDLIRPLHGEARETVGRDRSAVAAVGGGVAILGALPRKEAFLAHETGDAVTPSGATERTGESRTAISAATAGELLHNASP